MRKIIGWFERNRSISGILALLTASFIFYISSRTFGYAEPTFSYLPIIYHFGVFFALNFFLTLSLASKRKEFLFIAVLLSIIYAILDEIHQSFVPGRDPSIEDVLTDSVGIIVSSILILLSQPIQQKSLASQA